MELVTPRLKLRRAQPGDLAAFNEIMSDRAAMRFWSTAPHRNVDQTRTWLDEMIADGPPQSDDFVIEYEGRAIGKAGAWRLPEVGFILHPTYWGRGFASEALGAVIAHLFATYEIDAITAEADPRNEPSLGLLRRFGFAETGRASATFEIDGEISDSVYLALPRAAFRALCGIQAT
ncbi:MAG: GNAT family N-acetyltransferase [Caulobacteraceae bacterium]